MIEERDIQALQSRFDDRYKKIDDCDKEMREATEQHHELDTKFSVINTKLSALLWGVGVLGTAVVGVLVKMIFRV